jgi:hypothetical protein
VWATEVQGGFVQGATPRAHPSSVLIQVRSKTVKPVGRAAPAETVVDVGDVVVADPFVVDVDVVLGVATAVVVVDRAPECDDEQAAASTTAARGTRSWAREDFIACLDPDPAAVVPRNISDDPFGPSGPPAASRSRPRSLGSPAVAGVRDDGTFSVVTAAVNLAVAGALVTLLAGACSGSPSRGASSARSLAVTTTSSAPTTTTTSTTVAPPDGFAPVAAGSDLVQLVTPLGTILRIDPKVLEVAVVPGTTEPGGAFPEGGAVPIARRAALVAATNAGFKRADARGGEMVDGRTVGVLQPGAATFVIRADGSFDVGAWGQEVLPAPGDVAVLQNLLPLVANRVPAPDLGTDILGRWGLSFRPALPVAVWRSGLGIDARGRLLFAAGANIVPAQLAELLLAGGAIRAMETDINHLWVFAALFSHPDPAHPESVSGTPLLAGMTPTASHVLVPGIRDFLAVYRRAGPT